MSAVYAHHSDDEHPACFVDGLVWFVVGGAVVADAARQPQLAALGIEREPLQPQSLPLPGRAATRHRKRSMLLSVNARRAAPALTLRTRPTTSRADDSDRRHDGRCRFGYAGSVFSSPFGDRSAWPMERWEMSEPSSCRSTRLEQTLQTPDRCSPSPRIEPSSGDEPLPAQ